MKKLLIGASAGLSLLAAGAAAKFDPPSWVYMVAPPGTDLRLADPKVYTRPGSNLAQTQKVLQDPFTPPDWYPNEHPPLPKIVEFGRRPIVQPCMRCHLPNGAGHPESANIAGQPYNYIVRQMRDFASGARHSLGEGAAARSFNMVNIVRDMTEEEITASARYFADLKPVKWINVVETPTVPETYYQPTSNMRHIKPGGGREAIAGRIIEVPLDSLGADIRDSHASFTAYVPPGSIARGQTIVTTGGGGKTVACAICHGPDLKGLGEIPGIAGRSPTYMIRQMSDIQHSVRGGNSAALMQAVVEKLTLDDMVNITAYVGSLAP